MSVSCRAKYKQMKHITEGRNDISWLGSNCKEHFGKMLVRSVKVTEFETKTLERPMSDKDILAEFGPEEVSLGFLMGALKSLDKQHWYIFYIRDAEKTLWAVNAFWDGAGWGVVANSVSDPGRWDDGRRVVSRGFLGPTIKTLGNSEALAFIDEIEERLARLKKCI